MDGCKQLMCRDWNKILRNISYQFKNSWNSLLTKKGNTEVQYRKKTKAKEWIKGLKSTECFALESGLIWFICCVTPAYHRGCCGGSRVWSCCRSWCCCSSTPSCWSSIVYRCFANRTRNIRQDPAQRQHVHGSNQFKVTHTFEFFIILV